MELNYAYRIFLSEKHDGEPKYNWFKKKWKKLKVGIVAKEKVCTGCLACPEINNN